MILVDMHRNACLLAGVSFCFDENLFLTKKLQKGVAISL